MPFAIDEDQMKGNEEKQINKILSMDPAKPPVKQIPFMEYPRVVYKHPTQPYRVVEHRNTQHEVVQIEHIPSEHLTRVVADKKELEAALKDGWVKEPYIAKPPEDPNANLYAE